MNPIDRIIDGFESRTLPKTEWTHEAHLTVCWATVAQLGADAALVHLRDGIRSYNDAVGTVNNDVSGYHETLTRYYIGAVAGLVGLELAAIVANPICDRSAPLRHWTRERLFSTAARLGWCPPDLTPIAFPVPSADEQPSAS